MAPFETTIGSRRMRQEEKKNYRFVPFIPDAYQKIPKKQQKNSKKLKNTIMDPFQATID